MKDLVIAYRIYPGVSKAPLFHAESKWELSRFCLQSLRSALGNLKFKLWAILDGCPPEYVALFRSIFTQEEMEIVETAGIGNFNTFARQIDILMQQQEADLVFFAEDDYFYRPNALVEMVEFLRGNPGADFVTPYDHPDSYTTSSQHERHKTLAFGRRHWREASSTCLTFLTRHSILQATEPMLRSYSKGNMDCSMWLAMTQKLGLARPSVHAADLVRIKIWAKVWIWGWKKVLFSRPYSLWSPMPTLATHMESTGIAPLVPWMDEFVEAEGRQRAG